MYICKCGNLYVNSSRQPAPCEGCPDCGTQYVSEKSEPVIPTNHTFSEWTIIDNGARAVRQCMKCYAREIATLPETLNVQEIRK